MQRSLEQSLQDMENERARAAICHQNYMNTTYNKNSKIPFQTGLSMNRIFTSAINGNRDFDSSDITLGASEIMPITPMMPTHTEKTLEVELKRKAKYLTNPNSIFEETGPPFSLTSNFNRNEK